MTALWSRERRIGHFIWIVPAALVLACAAVVIWVPSPSSSKVGRLCDEAVHQLLTTKDPVELRRAMFLVRWFDCGIRRRLP